MKVLHLTLKKKWFDMIASGEKKEEYREIKPYWYDRLFDNEGMGKGYDIVRFRNGYAKDSPTVDVVCEDITQSTGTKEWGAESGRQYFVIQLGDIISINNQK